MQLLTGTSGFSYKEWKGSFYPEDLAQKRFLSYYAEHLGAVEINNTFYRMPKSSMFEGWLEEVPAGFRFSIKAPMRITHRRRLANADDEVAYLLEQTRVLGERLGVVLFQLPPNMKKDMARLSSFLELLPADLPATFEFRHASWSEDDEALDLLRSRDLAWCVADNAPDEGQPEVETRLVGGQTWGYLRLRRPDYDEASLASWLERLEATGWERAFVFFKHEDGGVGPALATRLAELAL